MTQEQLALMAGLNFMLNAAAWVICVCRMRLLDETVLWFVKVEYSTAATALVVSAFSPLWGEWPQWGQVGLSACILTAYLSSYFAWRRDGQDIAPDIVTDHAKLSTMKGHHD